MMETGKRIIMGWSGIFIILMWILVAISLLTPSVLAVNQTLNVSVTVPSPVAPTPPSGLERTLTGAGTGLAGFLTFSQAPIVNFILAVGLIAGVLIVVYGIVEMIKRAFQTSDLFVEPDEDEHILDED